MIDSEEAVREIMCTMLRTAGYRCRAVASGAQALTLLEAGDTVDLVTTDIMSAPLGGIRFLSKMKRKFPDIPVAVITAIHETSLVLGCIRDGAYDYLLKPFEREQLLNVVYRALASRRL